MQPFLEVIERQDVRQSVKSLDVIHIDKNTHFHYHPEVEILYFYQGKGSRLVGDDVGEFTEGDLIMLGENLPHDFNSKPDIHSRVSVIQFLPSTFKMVPEFAEIGHLLTKANQGLLFNNLSAEMAEHLVKFDSLSGPQKVITLLQLLDYLTTQPCTELSSIAFTEQQAQGNHLRLNKVIDFITMNYSDKIELVQMADLTCMTPQSFCRWFKKSMNTSFVNYLNKIRIEAACHLLLNSDKQISQIAQHCGFESFSNFNRTFSKLKGSSPRAYRQNTGF